MILRIAWRNVMHKKLRALASIGGVAFSILLVFMQLGIFSAAENSAEVVFRQLDFDVALASPQYVFLASAGSVPREAMLRVRDLPGVASAKPLYIGLARFRTLDDNMRRGVFTMGVDPFNSPFSNPEIQRQASGLSRLGTALADREARGEYGPRDVGAESDFGSGRIKIIGHYTMGAGFIEGTDMVVSDATFCHLLAGKRIDRPSLILVKAESPSATETLVERLRRELGPDVVPYTRREIIDVETNYFVNVKPIGIMFRAGVVVGFLVGAVTLYQILALQVANHIRELATMKAVGYGDAGVYGVVVAEGLMYALIGFAPAFLGGMALYRLLQTQANVPVWMTAERAAVVFLLTLAMCAISCTLALRKVRTADPADLFG